MHKQKQYNAFVIHVCQHHNHSGGRSDDTRVPVIVANYLAESS